jgi:hypothetical protein
MTSPYDTLISNTRSATKPITMSDAIKLRESFRVGYGDDTSGYLTATLDMLIAEVRTLRAALAACRERM